MRTEKAKELLALLDKLEPLYEQVLQETANRRLALELATDELKRTRLLLLREAEGKNAEAREAWVLEQPAYAQAASELAEAKREFAAIAAQHEELVARINYIRDATRLLSLMDNQ